MKKLIFILIVVLTYLTTNAEVRFVSKTGSSTPPYMSWATAADSIQKCINISSFGDTIYVGSGTYYEKVIMIPGLALIGSGMDSCIIDTKDLAVPQDFYSIIIADSSVFKGFKLEVSNDHYGNGIVTHWIDPINFAIIEENQICKAAYGCRIAFGNLIIRNNIFCQSGVGINIDDPNSTRFHQIYDNIFTDIKFNGIQIGSINGIIRNNFFNLNIPYSRGLTMFGSQLGLSIISNTIIAENGFQGIATSLHKPINCLNNLVIGPFNLGAIYTGENCKIKNNVIIESEEGIWVENGQLPIIQYNDFWNIRSFCINFNPDNTNLSVDPMFVDEENLDFHLQMFSPLIDAGDPNILDKDGSRSDIGIYGGPFGESYTYQDFAPKPPKNLTASLDSSTVTLNWYPNTEADFYLYRVYRDTVSNFIYDTTKIIAVTSDTAYTELLPSTQNSYYYKITAIDSQYNQSPASEEAAVLVVDAEEPKLIANDYQFYPNYPNPFNPATTLSYRLKDNGTVRLVVYDIKGELIEELVNEYQQAGYYEVDWNAEKRKLSSGIYLFRIEVKNENNIPVFSDLRKSILVK